MIEYQFAQELTDHDCKASPMDGCSGCEAILRARLAPKARPDYSFKRTNQSADYPAGFNLI